MKELGELIRGAREQKGVSLDEACAATRIRRRYLGAIEDGEFRGFPGPAYVTGFLRNYAVYLGLNPEEILQTYHTMAPVATTTINLGPATTVGVERLRRRSRKRLTWSCAGILMFLIVGLGIEQYAARHPAGGAQPPISSVGLLPSHPPSKARIQSTSGFPPVGVHLPPRSARKHRNRKQARIGILALRTAWIRVAIDGKQVYWGPLYAGSYHHWSGKRIELATHRGTAFRLHVDGELIGRISPHPGRVRGVATPSGWQRTR
ncbi:MAG TPA: helix-turn-helix domain-containing protein [Chloroflexota bacterium]|nr:helix-turn-helix domain-containing protein [Chloroflexota bacterium]